MEVVYLGISGLLWLATVGLAWVCQRLQGPRSPT